jgi:hypothetical protein
MNTNDITEGPFKSLGRGFAKGFQAGKASPNMLNRGIKKALDPDTYGKDDEKGGKVDWTPIPVAPVKVDPQMVIPKSVKEIPAGTGFKDQKGIMWQWAGQSWVKKMPGGWQGGQINNNSAFKMYIDALKQGKAYKPIKRESDMKDVNEGQLGDMAHRAEADHEVQMARAELYKLAKYSIKLHDMLKGVSEAEGLEGWVQSKITKAANDIGSVYHHMDYEEASEGEMPEPKINLETKAHPYKDELHAKLAEARNKELSEGPFKGLGKTMMKQKLKKQYKKADLANFDKSGIDTSGKTPDEIGQMKSDYYHDNMDKAARAKKAGDRLQKKK